MGPISCPRLVLTSPKGPPTEPAGRAAWWSEPAVPPRRCESLLCAPPSPSAGQGEARELLVPAGPSPEARHDSKRYINSLVEAPQQPAADGKAEAPWSPPLTSRESRPREWWSWDSRPPGPWGGAVRRMRSRTSWLPPRVPGAQQARGECRLEPRCRDSQQDGSVWGLPGCEQTGRPGAEGLRLDDGRGQALHGGREGR